MSPEKPPVPIIVLQKQISELLTPQFIKEINTYIDPEITSNRNITFSKEEMENMIEKILRKNPEMSTKEIRKQIIAKRTNALLDYKMAA